jgi:prolipoprotein diacylglyceryltransferase
MDPTYKIVLLSLLILGMCWLLAKAQKFVPGAKPDAEKKMFNKLVFWLLFVPVIGTTVGTLILIWLKTHHLI